MASSSNSTPFEYTNRGRNINTNPLTLMAGTTKTIALDKDGNHIIVEQPQQQQQQETSITIIEQEPLIESAKQKLITRLPFVASNMQNILRVVVELMRLNILHWRERDIIMNHNTEFSQCTELCRIILYKGIDVIESFEDVLRATGNKTVANALAAPLTQAELSQSFQDCVQQLNLDKSSTTKPHPDALYEIDSFYSTLASTNSYYFVQNGKPGILGVSQILSEYTVTTEKGLCLFYFLWKPVPTKLQLAHKRPVNFCDCCWSQRRGITRICQNLLGNTIMEVDTDMSVRDIRVGGSYHGQIIPHLFLYTFIRGYYVVDSNDKILFYICKHGNPYSRYIKCSNPRWDIYEYGYIARGEIVSSFGHLPNQSHEEEEHLLPTLRHKFVKFLRKEDKLLLFGAGIMIMDHEVRRLAWSVRKVCCLLCVSPCCFCLILFPFLIGILITIIASFAAST